MNGEDTKLLLPKHSLNESKSKLNIPTKECFAEMMGTAILVAIGDGAICQGVLAGLLASTPSRIYGADWLIISLA